MISQRHGDCCFRALVRPVVGLVVISLAGVAHAQPADEPPVPEQPAPEPEQAAPAPEQPAQTITVRGRVSNSLGRPVRGARVSIEGSTTQVSTDKQGWFRIEAKTGVNLVVEAEGDEV